MEKEKLKSLAYEEILNLKKFAEKEEIENMNFYQLKVAHSDKCIYGQMTGSCESLRAIQLLKKCAVPVSDRSLDATMDNELNAVYFSIGAMGGNRKYYSALEVWIFKYNKSNEDIIKFLKGEIETLILE